MTVSPITGIPNNLTATTTASNTSGAVDLDGWALVGLAYSTNAQPSTSMTFTTATSSTGTYLPVMTSTGGTVTVTASTQAAQFHSLDPVNFWGVRFLKVVGSSTSMNTTLSLAIRPLR